MNTTKTCFYVENDRKLYGPFKTADEAAAYAEQFAIRLDAVHEFRAAETKGVATPSTSLPSVLSLP